MQHSCFPTLKNMCLKTYSSKNISPTNIMSKILLAFLTPSLVFDVENALIRTLTYVRAVITDAMTQNTYSGISYLSSPKVDLVRIRNTQSPATSAAEELKVLMRGTHFLLSARLQFIVLCVVSTISSDYIFFFYNVLAEGRLLLSFVVQNDAMQ